MLSILWLADTGSARAGVGGKKARWAGNPELAKVSSHLLRARDLARQGRSAAELGRELPLVTLRQGHPEIEVRLRESTPELRARLEASGMRVTHWSERWARASGWCDAEQLDEIAAIPEVATIHPRYGARTRTGSTFSQGDRSIHADDARLAFGVDGTGIRVGILSDSFYATPTVLGSGTVSGSGCSRILAGSNPQASSDLPSQVVVLDNCDSGDGCLDGHTDEGAALAEIVHDLAPDAEILFHTAFRNEADFADGIGELVNCGADVVIDDVIHFAEPMFQDGVVAQAAEEAAQAGVVYFSAAGNEAEFGVDEVFVDSDPTKDANEDDLPFPTDGVDLHDFPGGDRFAAIRVPDGCGIEFVLQWNEPFSGTLGPGSSRDLDLYFCSGNSLTLNSDAPPALAACDFSPTGALASSTDSQGCGSLGFPAEADPFEVLAWSNGTGSPVTGFVGVDHYCGLQTDVRFRIVTLASGSGCSFATAVRQADCTQVGAGEAGVYCFESGIFDQAQIYGHPSAANVGSVAAVFYLEIDGGGAAEPPSGQINVRPSSSLGGDLPFFFDATGSPLPGAPQTRSKPELAAPEGVNNTFFGGIDLEPDGFPNFRGTSAAAPHAAAVAALLLDRDPNLTPAQVISALTANATDIEAAGWDPLSGHGLIDAHAAVLATPACGDRDLADPGAPVTGTVIERACLTLSAGPYVVASTGDVTFVAGEKVVLAEGFEAAGVFTAEIDSLLLPP